MRLQCICSRSVKWLGGFGSLFLILLWLLFYVARTMDLQMDWVHWHGHTGDIAYDIVAALDLA